MMKSLLDKKWENLSSCFYNDFERVLFPRYPELWTLKNDMLKYEPLTAMVSGSGSAVFSLYTDQKCAQHAYKKLRKKYKNIYLVKTLHDRSWRS